MKTIALITAALILAAVPCREATASSSSIVTVGSRYHVDHSVFAELPFTGNFSAVAGYEWHEEAGYWQVALDYVPSVVGTNSTLEGVYTPQLNLIFNDGIWRGGAGVMNTHFKEGSNPGRWTGFYWQFIAGINLPLKQYDFDLLVFYVFEDAKSLRHFDLNDLEFGLFLNFNI